MHSKSAHAKLLSILFLRFSFTIKRYFFFHDRAQRLNKNYYDKNQSLEGVFFGALSYTAINFIIVSIPSLSPDIQNTFQGLVLIVVILIQTLSPIVKEKITLYRKRKAQK